MKVLAIDTENNTWNKGAVFDRRFKNICYSWADESGFGAESTTPESLESLQRRIDEARIIVGFNLKYDLHVLRKLGIGWRDTHRFWDCQLGEYVRSNQTWKYPSLNESVSKYSLGTKIDIIAEQYWQKGIQTEDIPWSLLAEYAARDSELTLKLYLNQIQNMSPSLQRLVRLKSMDLLVLEEMEWNGLRFDEELCKKRQDDIKAEMEGITQELSKIYPDVPINFNSGDHLSAFLYGGKIVSEQREVIGFYKTGAKIGQPRYRVHKIDHELPRLVTPLRGSELAKEGYWATNADTLLKLKGGKKTKHIIELIQKQTRLQTLLSKTYEGLIKVREEQNWEPGYLHGQFQQVTTATGRLSSIKPNLQNIDSEANDLFISRFEENSFDDSTSTSTVS